MISIDSGYNNAIYYAKSNDEYLRFLNCFLLGNREALNLEFEEHPEFLDSQKKKALFLLNRMFLGYKISSFHISIQSPKPSLLDELAYELCHLYKILRDNIVIPDLEDLDLFQYLSLIPNLVIYYSDVLLRYYPSEKSLQNCLQYLESDQYFEDLVDENLIVQRYRLQALYYRRQANLAAADQAWIRYIQAFKPAKQENYTLEKLSHVSAYPSSQVLSNMAQIYSQINETNTEVLLLSGNSNETCFHYQCTDCCTKDFPTLSLVEYLHIINNAPRELLEIFSKRAKMIQEEYKQRYNSSLEIIDQTVHPRGFENPQNFRFRCPFLGDDNLCQVYEWRPLICRAFGLAAHSEESIQSCGYFLTQYHYSSSNRYEMPVLDLAPIVALLGGANKYQAKSSPRYSNMKQPVGTAVAWLLEEIQ